ncbi:MAG: c-type cytochrome biogenesis protein CcmI, partial [Gammaproteobacteria bacterium]|nr:c-type cytochrome biogenesis protein CcmI [Gammaproteobacteria bacterium]
MTTFWIISIIMLLIAVWFVVSALMGKTQLGNSDQNQQNILIAKEQLNAIEKELAEGDLNES